MIQLNDLNKLLHSRNGHYAAWLINILMLVGIFSSCINTLQIFTSQPTRANSNAAITVNETRQLPDIGSLHLFGTAQLNPKDIPLSQLQLQLIGLFTAQPQQNSQAIIATPGGQEKIYRIGDTLTGGAEVYQILSDSVILKRNGEFERLNLPRPSLQFSPAPQGLLDSEP